MAELRIDLLARRREIWHIAEHHPACAATNIAQPKVLFEDLEEYEVHRSKHGDASRKKVDTGHRQVWDKNKCIYFLVFAAVHRYSSCRGMFAVWRP